MTALRIPDLNLPEVPPNSKSISAKHGQGNPPLLFVTYNDGPYIPRSSDCKIGAEPVGFLSGRGKQLPSSQGKRDLGFESYKCPEELRSQFRNDQLSWPTSFLNLDARSQVISETMEWIVARLRLFECGMPIMVSRTSGHRGSDCTAGHSR